MIYSTQAAYAVMYGVDLDGLGIKVKYVLIPHFRQLPGYTDKALRGKFQEGVWLKGKHYRKVPDGHLAISMVEYYCRFKGY